MTGGVIPAGGGAQRQPQAWGSSGCIQVTPNHLIWPEQCVHETSSEVGTCSFRERLEASHGRPGTSDRGCRMGASQAPRGSPATRYGVPRTDGSTTCLPHFQLSSCPRPCSLPPPLQGDVSTGYFRGWRASDGGWPLHAFFPPPSIGSRTGGPELHLAFRPAVFGPQCVF